MSGRSPRWYPGIKNVYEASFARNSWAQIIEACQKKCVPETWGILDRKPVTIYGTSYVVDVIGINHDEYADERGIAPLTFQLRECYGTEYVMNDTRTNVGGWETCKMRTEQMPIFLSSLIVPEVANAIRAVKKLTSVGNGSDVIHTTADKLFLLSEVEIFGEATRSAAGEGTQYERYAGIANTIKNLGTSKNNWWTRSAYNGGATRFLRVSSAGDISISYPEDEYGVSFAFCF